MSVTRRGFLAGSAAAAATPAALKGAAKSRPAAAETVFAAGPNQVVLEVNGGRHAVEVEPRTTLLDALRWKLGLTGPKEVCDRGACGACTVLVDDRPTVSCMMLAVDAVGRKITTVEGLGTPERPGRVQQALIHHDAVQCGYCIPGFVVSLEGALRADSKTDAAGLRQAIAGNLCRCGTYNKMFEACERLAGGDPAAGVLANAPACAESTGGRVDAAAKITGTAVFGADLHRPGMLFAQHVLCPYGKATLVSADLDTVRRLSGVIEAELGVGREHGYSGAPAGHVCANSREALRDAVSALRCVWEPVAVETDPRVLHEQQHGAFPRNEERLIAARGGAEAAKALAAAHVVMERVYETQVQNHNPLEPHGATIDPTVTPAEGWVSTQGTGSCAGPLAQALQLSRDQVAVRCEFVGGGFGSKFGLGREGQLAAELARKHSLPVRVFNDRENEQLDTGNRPGSMQWMKIGAAADGKLLGGLIYTAGIVGVGGGGGATNPWLYDFGAIAKDHEDVRGSHGAPRAFRAPGRPQGTFALESMLDEIAEELGMDPIEIRLRNETSEVRKQMLRAGVEEFGWSRRQPTGKQGGRVRTGFGVAAGDWSSQPGRCAIRMQAHHDGRVEVWSGTQDIGQGQRTLIADIAADHLAVPRALITVHIADSRFPAGPASGGSTTGRVTAPAVRDAAQKLLDGLAAASGLEVATDWKAACARLGADGLTVDGEFNPDYWGEGGSEAVQFAEVEVDADTGVVRARRILAYQACGLVANRLTAENQLIGGVIQGVSYALFEERATDPVLGGQMNADLLGYKIAGAIDVPEIVPRLWGAREGKGVRSLGEPTTVPTSGAIANAVANALGVRVRSLPITPAKVRAALEGRA
ncbi:MAG TPA: molybdopterin-dependent oxidoreductase [Planctomycetota bacterium]